MQRVIAFIDGFNMYHALVEARLNSCKWLNYRSLAEAFIATSTQRLERVYYFSALVPWDQQKTNRHKIYIQALRSAGVDVVLGKFKKVTRKCLGSCREKFQTFEEKETDVNIALTMLKLAMQDMYDMALLFSSDSDLVGAVKTVKEVAPHKHIKVVIPFKRTCLDLKNICDSSAKIKHAHFARHQFSSLVQIGPYKENVLLKPSEWT
jgi:uncharacterized LabA/DUF88 family protein